MTLDQYIAMKRRETKKIPADIVERWNTRALPRGLHNLGEAGAEQYLRDYGQGIGAPKLVNLARQAEAAGFPEMAMGFWKRACRLDPAASAEAPVVESDAPAASPAAPQSSPASVEAPSQPRIAGLPDYLQPGCIVTMQAVDAAHPRDFYINNDAYWGQPKRDGRRLVVAAGPEAVFYQSRSAKLDSPPDDEMHQALQAAVACFGPFVLDGELWHADALGGEHRTGAQAATTNLANGYAGYAGMQPRAVYAIFKALYAAGQDLTVEPESERIAQGEIVGAWLAARAPGRFEVLPTARTREEKAALARRQSDEGREGEVWVQHGCRYTGGKDPKSLAIVRTKYVVELDVVVMGLTPSQVAGRPFGAIQVGVMNGGLKSIGEVGTGYTAAQMKEIARRHAAAPGQVVITCRTQRFTENGQLWHGSFVDFRDDKRPEDCRLDGAQPPVANAPASPAAPPTAGMQLALF